MYVHDIIIYNTYSYHNIGDWTAKALELKLHNFIMGTCSYHNIAYAAIPYTVYHYDLFIVGSVPGIFLYALCHAQDMLFNIIAMYSQMFIGHHLAIV